MGCKQLNLTSGDRAGFQLPRVPCDLWVNMAKRSIFGENSRRPITTKRYPRTPAIHQETPKIAMQLHQGAIIVLEKSLTRLNIGLCYAVINEIFAVSMGRRKKHTASPSRPFGAPFCATNELRFRVHFLSRRYL